MVRQVRQSSCHTTTPLGVWGVAWQKNTVVVRCGKSRAMIRHAPRAHRLGAGA